VHFIFTSRSESDHSRMIVKSYSDQIRTSLPICNAERFFNVRTAVVHKENPLTHKGNGNFTQRPSTASHKTFFLQFTIYLKDNGPLRFINAWQDQGAGACSVLGW